MKRWANILLALTVFLSVISAVQAVYCRHGGCQFAGEESAV